MSAIERFHCTLLDETMVGKIIATYRDHLSVTEPLNRLLHKIANLIYHMQLLRTKKSSIRKL